MTDAEFMARYWEVQRENVAEANARAGYDPYDPYAGQSECAACE